MSNPVDRLHIFPLFYDALSGEFMPPSDPRSRAHTLGRLAYAGYSKGLLVAGDVYDSVQKPFSAIYRPSWAHTVEVEVAGRINHHSDDSFLRSLTLRAKTGVTMSVVSHATPDNGPWVEIIGADERSKNTPLELGEELNHAKALITEQAQMFFDSIS